MNATSWLSGFALPVAAANTAGALEIGEVFFKTCTKGRVRNGVDLTAEALFPAPAFCQGMAKLRGACRNN